MSENKPGRGIDLVPHNHALGIQTVEIERGMALLELPYDAKLVGNPDTGTLHGGAITALLDASSGAAVFTALTEWAPIATLDLRIDYLRAAEAGRAVRCRARCYKLTRNVAFTRAIAYHDSEDDPIASAAGTFMLHTKPGVKTEPGPGDKMTIRETFEAAKRAGDLRAMIDAVPYSKFIGLDAELVDGELITTMRFAPHLIGNPALPALHGGTLGALLESAAIFELLWRSETVVLPKTITFTVDYLRSGAARDTYAHASITRQGRRVANVRVEAWQVDRALPVATAHAIFLVMGN